MIIVQFEDGEVEALLLGLAKSVRLAALDEIEACRGSQDSRAYVDLMRRHFANAVAAIALARDRRVTGP